LKEKIPVPPPPAQARVEELVAREAKVADSVQRAVDGILEYRARLIADVVLGQVDVRSAASSLVDEEIPALAEDVEETEGPEGVDTTDEVVA
jgi:type I restriction enzyme S subunit